MKMTTNSAISSLSIKLIRLLLAVKTVLTYFYSGMAGSLASIKMP